MDFLRACAARLDGGEEAASVLESMRQRYTTVRSMSVKTCIVRRLCAPTQAFVEAAEGDVALLQGTAKPPAHFPPRLPPNAAALKVSRKEARQCKRLGAEAAVRKNKHRRRVNGGAVLSACRNEVDAVLGGERGASPRLVLALMLLTGRRTCEIVNGRSAFRVEGGGDGLGPSLHFEGQAKRRGSAEGYTIPVLHDPARLLLAIEKLREWSLPRQREEEGGLTVNQAASQKYQSWLRRVLLAHPVLREAKTPHSLRGIYARMAYALFDWEGDYSEAYVVMRILGHAGLNESLVYTPVHLGDSFPKEGDKLGAMRLREQGEEDPSGAL